MRFVLFRKTARVPVREADEEIGEGERLDKERAELRGAALRRERDGSPERAPARSYSETTPRPHGDATSRHQQRPRTPVCRDFA